MPVLSIVTPFRVVLLFIVTAMVALLVLPNLTVDLLPGTKTSQLQVSFSLGNSSPDIVEQRVTSILEGSFAQLPQLKKITSVSGYNRGSVQLYFDKSADMQFKQFEVASMIRRIYPLLPAEASYPVVSTTVLKEKRNNPPFLIYTINAAQQAFQVKREAEALFRRELAVIQGLSNISVSGVGNLQVTIQYDHARCEAWGIPFSEITGSLQSYVKTLYPGTVAANNGEQVFLRIPASIASLSDIENLLIVSNTSRLIRLKDVARVFIEEQEPQRYFRINGQNSVSMSITAREGENKIMLAKQVQEIIDRAKEQLPAGYEIRLEYDDTAFLSNELEKTNSRATISIVILLLFMLLLYRNWRYLLILFAGLCINLFITIILAWIFNINIHLYTIAGVAIAFGLIIDNAIVMIDHYHQYRNRKIFLAILASTLTTVSALCLIFFLPEKDRQSLEDFSLITVLALLSSMFVALWFTPALYELLLRTRFAPQATGSLLLKKRKFRRLLTYRRIYFKTIRSLSAYRGVFLAGMLLLFGLPVFLLPAQWEGERWYNSLYNKTIGAEKYQKDIRPHIDKWTGGALRMFATGVYENSGYRSIEKTKLFISAELPFGNTLEQMDHILSEFEKHLSKVTGIDKYVTSVYSGQYGSIEISFKEGYEDSYLPYQLKSTLIAKTLEWGGVEWNVYGVGQAFSNMGGNDMPAFRLALKGYNYDELEKQANYLAGKLLRHKRIQKVNTNERLDLDEKQSREFVLQINDVEMALSGTNKNEILKKVASLGKPAAPSLFLTLEDQYYPVILKEKNAQTYSGHDLLNNPFSVDSGRQMRLKDVGEIVLQHTAGSIHKENRQYIRSISFEYMGAMQFGEKYVEKVLEEMRSELPVGYTIERESWNWGWGETKRQYLLLLLLALVNFFICSILFETLRQPLFIMTMIPVSFIGLFLIFSIGGFYFDQGGYAAFIMLGGLVVNAGIFIINDLNNLRKLRPTASYNKLLIKAVFNRSRTILLTTISTCCGLTPFLVEGQQEVFWFSLAVGTLGGMIFSLLAAFIVLPLLLWKRQKNSSPYGSI